MKNNDKGDPRFVVLAGRILLALGRPKDAIALLRQALNHQDPSCEMLTGLMESLFALGRYDELRQLCRQYKMHLQVSDLSVKSREALLLWGAEERVLQ
jgi:tetratricopeptide (TPR) repeat protein